MLKKLAISMMLFIMLAIPASATSGYLVSQDSVVVNPGDTIDVEVWVDVDEPTGCTGGSIEITYCATCTDATAYTPAPSGAWTMNTCNSVVSGREFITILADPPKTGSLLVGTLTFECMSPGDCQTPLTFDTGCLLNNGTIKPIEDVEWIDGSFKCGEPEPEQCLGMCYEGTVCDGTPIGKMNCSACLAMAGTSWLNDPCPVSACGCTCDSMCWNESIGGCPECCDGVDNDGVNGTDWPADPQCGCCIDGNETDGTDSCPDPCVPELPTLALAGIGILGIALLARKRD